jgi:poly(A) polymerase
MLAAMLWHDVQDGWRQRQDAGESPFPALQAAIDAAFDARIGDISGRGKLAVDMREIWMLQPRLERRAASSALAMLEQPRFRAGLDFLRLRGEVGEADPELARWWEALFEAGDDERRRMLDAIREQRPRRVRKAAPADERSRAGESRSVDDAAPRGDERGQSDGQRRGVEGGPSETEGAATEGAAPRRRRRRRRRPAADGAGTPG